MKSIEEHLKRDLLKVLGERVPIVKGPFVKSKYTGIQPELFVHAAKLIDFDGVMPDGAQTVRRPVIGKASFKGTEEERNGRIEILITCTTGNYGLLQDILGIVLSSSLLSLQTLPKIPLGNTRDSSTKLQFVDFTKHMHSTELSVVSDEDLTFYKGEIILYLNGFIHVYITKSGGFSAKSTSLPKIKTKKLTTKSIERTLGKKVRKVNRK